MIFSRYHPYPTSIFLFSKRIIEVYGLCSVLFAPLPLVFRVITSISEINMSQLENICSLPNISTIFPVAAVGTVTVALMQTTVCLPTSPVNGVVPPPTGWQAGNCLLHSPGCYGVHVVVCCAVLVHIRT